MSEPNMIMPPRVQIQTKAGCNGRCVFCPNKDIIEAGLPHGKMSEELFRKIIDELAEAPPRRIGLYMMNEPLSDDRLPEFVRYVAERVPSTRSQVISNGVFLDEACAEALMDAGLRELKVSLQSLDSETNRQLMGYGSEEVIENCIAAQRIFKQKRVKDFQFRVSMVVTRLNEAEIAKARVFWRKHGIRLVTSALENRGGNIREAPTLNPHDMASMGDCIRPSRDLMVLFNGDVPLCCVDWHRTTILGNLAEQSIKEVWNGPTVRAIREGLKTGDRQGLPPICFRCTQSAAPDHHRRGLKGVLSRMFGSR